METWRPCDQVESAVAWKSATERENGPSALIFSPTNLTQQPRNETQLQNEKGYILKDCQGTPELILIATGSEVGITSRLRKNLEAEGRQVRVVSMPCTERFDKQPAEYKEQVLPKAVRARIAVEAVMSTTGNATPD